MANGKFEGVLFCLFHLFLHADMLLVRGGVLEFGCAWANLQHITGRHLSVFGSFT